MPLSPKTDEDDEAIWMPHAGHFILGNQCQFRLNTYVNGYIISTVGEYVPDEPVRRIFRESRKRRLDLRGDAERAEFGFEEIGCDRLYETMVFKAKRSTHQCCPYEMDNGSELDFQGYNDAPAAYQGHLAMIKKWSARSGDNNESTEPITL